MKGSGVASVAWLLLCLDYAQALIPRAVFTGARQRAKTMRRRVGQRVSSPLEKDGEKGNGTYDDAVGVGPLFWRRSFSKKRTGSLASSASTEPPSAMPPPTGGSSGSSVIHLGRLRIPQSRRLDLTASAAPASSASAPAGGAVAEQERVDGGEDDAGEAGKGEGEEEEEEEDDRGDGRVIEVSGNRDVLPPAFKGGPSVIPFGVGEGRLESGVVQIPLRYTVGETVDFIRTIATVDRDYRREQKQPAASAAPGVAEPDTAGKGGGEDAAVVAEEMGSSLSSRIYVTENGALKGYITMAVLLTHPPETPVTELLRELEEMLREGDSWEQAAHRLRQANVMAAPVVDEDGVLVAVLNPSDLLQEMEIEATDDIMRQSGSGGGESYFGTPLPSLVASRVGWLVSLLGLQSFSSLILQSFQKTIERNIVIALFLTMLTGTAGNAGNQSSAIVIRGLATGEIHQGNRWRVIWREARAGVASAVVLSIASFVRVLLTPGATTIATLAVSIAMGATVMGAVMFGTVAPIVLHGMGVDPVNFASPALATLTDVSGVFILCSVAKLMLGHV